MATQFLAMEIEGLNEVLKGLDQLEQNIIDEVKGEMEAAAHNIVRMAKNSVPKDTGLLGNRISAEKGEDGEYEVVAQTDYAAYVEFGTGGLVDVPPGLEDIAILFKGQGIRQVNLPARPYLFPAYAAEAKLLIKRLKKIIPQKATRGITVILPGSGSTVTSITTI